MTTKDKIARRKLSSAGTGQRARERQPRLQGDGLRAPAVLRDPPQLPDLRRRGPDRPAAWRQRPAPEPGAAEIETAILDHALAHPCHGAMRVEQELCCGAIQVSAGGVRGVWQRHGLLTKHERLLRLERRPPSASSSSPKSRSGCWSASRPSSASATSRPRTPGALVAVDTFFVGTLKGVGKVYLQTAIDCHSRYAWARLYPSKLPITAVHLMNNDVIADLRGRRRQDRGGALRQRPRVLRPARPAPLRAVPAARGYRASHHEGQAAAVQRHRRAPAPHAARRALPRRRPAHLVRDHRGDADAFSTTTWWSTIISGPTRVAA